MDGILGRGRKKEEFIDEQDGFKNFWKVLGFGWVCGCQDSGSESATNTLKTRRGRSVSVQRDVGN